MRKNVLMSVGPLAGVIVLFIIVGNYGFGRIGDLRSQISKAQSDKQLLTGKLNTLRTVNEIASTGSQAASSALPAKNSSLIVLTQVKSLAGQKQVVINNLKSGSETKGSTGVSSTAISFDLVGPREGVLSFLDQIERTAPIVLLTKIKMSENGGETRATITLNSFWAALPTQLPAITQSITELSSDENSLLENISNLVQPQFVEVPPAQGAGKTNPFQ